jgi:hypothetical protein
MEKESKYKFELGEIVRLKGSYHDFFITGRGEIDHLDKREGIVYFGNLNGDMPRIANEYELERK